MSKYLDVPPPCPVDDAWCTTCVSPDYQGHSDRRVVLVEQQPPASRVVIVNGQVVSTRADVPFAFSTAEYRGTTATPQRTPRPEPPAAPPAAAARARVTDRLRAQAKPPTPKADPELA